MWLRLSNQGWLKLVLSNYWGRFARVVIVSCLAATLRETLQLSKTERSAQGCGTRADQNEAKMG